MTTVDDHFEEFLLAISDCFTAKNFAAWEARVILPFSLVSRKGPVLLATREALQANFNHYLVACEVMKIDLIHRRRISLEDADDGTWIGTYETNLLCNGKRATAPYTASALLETGPDGMRMSAVLNARGHVDWTGIDG